MYAHKSDILDKVDQFLERHTISKLAQGEVDIMNMSVFTKKIKSQINNVPKQKVLGTDAFTGEF